MTFTIAARCPLTGMLGVAVASASLACGSAAPFVRNGVGALATQAFGNPFLGVDGLRLLAEGRSPDQIVSTLLPADPGRDFRQLLIVDASGRTASHTGSECLNWAGVRLGQGYIAGGNRLAGEQVVAGMAEAFEAAESEPFPERLVRALEAGDTAGGDRGGRQSAALVVFWDQDYRYYDLRVDDHSAPVTELRRIFEMRKAAIGSRDGWRPTREYPLPPGWLEEWPELKKTYEGNQLKEEAAR